MNTYREIVFLILDEIKGSSDDFSFNEQHIIFLMDKYRAVLLKQRYSDIKKEIPDSNYQSICLNLIEVPAISGEPCEGGSYLRSLDTIPFLLDISKPNITSVDFFQGEFAYISRSRMRYVGHNKYLKNMIYASIAPDKHLYFKSSGSDFLHLEKVQMSGIFESPSLASKMSSCDKTEGENYDVLDLIFPLEEGLVPPLIQMILQELLGAAYRPKDSINNASDDLANIADFIKRNMKSNIQKQIDGEE